MHHCKSEADNPPDPLNYLLAELPSHTYPANSVRQFLPRCRHACVGMAIAHAAAPHDPLPHTVVLETAVGDQDFREEVEHYHSNVCDGLIAGSFLLIERHMLRSGKGHLLNRRVHCIEWQQMLSASCPTHGYRAHACCPTQEALVASIAGHTQYLG